MFTVQAKRYCASLLAEEIFELSWKWICVAYCHEAKSSLIRYCHRQSGRTAYRPEPTDPDLRLTAIRSSGLPFKAGHSRDPSNYMDHYSFTDLGGMEGWVGLVCWPIVATLSTKWSHVNHRSGVVQGKSVCQRPTSYLSSHAANQVPSRLLHTSFGSCRPSTILHSASRQHYTVPPRYLMSVSEWVVA